MFRQNNIINIIIYNNYDIDGYRTWLLLYIYLDDSQQLVRGIFVSFCVIVDGAQIRQDSVTPRFRFRPGYVDTVLKHATLKY